MTSTPKRQKIREGTYTPTTVENRDGDLKRKSPEEKSPPQKIGKDLNDELLAVYNNPYLAHMLPDQGYAPQVAATGPLREFKRQQTTSQQAQEAEDGPTNPFTLRPLTQQYFTILKKRRELPVHAQRYALSDPFLLIPQTRIP